jgi:hypothetical protein
MNSRDGRCLLDDVFLQPWFLPLSVAVAVRGLLPGDHRHKMRFYFEDYGCIKCGKKDVRYGSNAMCKICVQQVKLKMFWAIRRRWTAREFGQEQPRTFKRMADAQRMLRDLVSRPRRSATYTPSHIPQKRTTPTIIPARKGRK